MRYPRFLLATLLTVAVIGGSIVAYPEVALAGPCGAASAPNPPYFITPPAPSSASSISMVSVTVIPGPCNTVTFTFAHAACGVNDGTGGSDISQSSTSYTDTGMQPNKCYAYTLQDINGGGYTSTLSTASTTYTFANTPGTPTLGTPTATTLTLTNAENSNPSASPTTNFAVQITVTAGSDATWNNKWVDGSGNPSASAVWLSDAQLDNLVITGLQSSVTYAAASKARNTDTVETSLSSTGSNTTSAGGGGATRIIRIRGGTRFRGGVRLK